MNRQGAGVDALQHSVHVSLANALRDGMDVAARPAATFLRLGKQNSDTLFDE
jgi:hypothetical protein